LEDFVAWGLDIKVENQPDPNLSLEIAEALGTASRRRPILTEREFDPIVALFEPYREQVEWRLDEFEDEYMSWRDYAGASFDFIPDEVWAKAFKQLETYQFNR
jgi:hypothetical protein